IDIGMPMSAAIDSSQLKEERSMSIVREALGTSVMWIPPFTPPVMFHMVQVSVLPNRRSPASALARAPSTLSRIHLVFGPEKYVARGSPTFALYLSAPSPPPSSTTIAWVRVSCHTIALYTGSPVVLSHTTAVSRWFVIPTA